VHHSRCTPRLVDREKQGSKIHSALEQHRQQLQNQFVALHECLVDYEFLCPAGVRLEWHTPRVARPKQTGDKIHSALEQRSSQVQQTVCMDVSSNTSS